MLYLYSVFKVHPDSFEPVSGDNEIRTRDPLLARQVLSQLSYTPIIKLRRPSTLPGSCPPSTIDRLGLNRRVRNGNGCVPQAHHHRKSILFRHTPSKLNTSRRNFSTELFRSSPRSISIGQLNTLPCLHLQPINLIIFKGSYFRRMGNLILRAASRLDAFSVYPFHT